MNEFNISINKEEVLRYLGYKDQIIDEKIMNTIDECIKEVKEIITPRVIYEYKDIKIIDEGVEILGTNLQLKEKTNLTKALILDSCATTAVEEVCDIVEEEVRKKAENDNMDITFRYSPGYGDLPLDVQNSFLRTLDAQKRIGLIASENNLLFPRKSVTAIIGIIEKGVSKKKKSCKECSNYENCSFRREGESCGA